MFVRNIEIHVLFLCKIYKNIKFIKIYHFRIGNNNALKYIVIRKLKLFTTKRRKITVSI